MSNDIDFPIIERTTYLPGVPCMVDTEQPDPLAAAEFYGGLFGWEFEDMVPPDVDEHYLVGTLNGLTVSAVASPTPGAAPADAAPTWNTYVSVADADATVAHAVKLGAEVTMDPFDVGPPGSTAGRLAAIVDPDGAPIRFWQPGERQGTQLVNAPASWQSSDLNTATPATASAFYGALFGWETMTMGFGGEESTVWRRPGYGDFLAEGDPDVHERHAAIGAPEGFSDTIGWLAAVTDDAVASSRALPYWSVTFGVGDTNATVERAVSLGAEIVSPPVDELGGMVRTATIRDPQGAELIVASFDPTAGSEY